MSQVTAVEWGASQRAALDHGKPMVYVCPPAGWTVRPLFARLPVPDHANGLRTVGLVPDSSDALDVAAALADMPAHQHVHACTGLGRTERLLRGGLLTSLLAAPADALELTKRAALKTDTLAHVLIMWPERFDPEAMAAVDSVLSEMRALQKIIVTAEPDRVADVIERQARRAPIAAFADVPVERIGVVQFALVDTDGRARAVRAALDASATERIALWVPYASSGMDAVPIGPDIDLLVGDDVAAESEAAAAGRLIAADLPSPTVLAHMRRRANEVVVLVRPTQLAYLETMVAQTRTMRLPSAVDRARDRLLAVRNRLRAQAETADLTGHLMAIEPLMEEFDPAVLAAAALAGWQVAPLTPSTWTHVHINVGRRDGVGPGDFVGLLVNAVGLQREDVGRIDLREQFSLVEVRPEDAERTVNGLAGQTLRGRRVVARLDRR